MNALGTPEPTGHRDGAFGLCECDGRVLLVRTPRAEGGQTREFWDLPGGGLLAGEGLTEGLAREWREETGLEARVGELLLVVEGKKRRAAGAPPIFSWRSFTFRVASDGEPRPSKEVTDAVWVPRSEVSSYLTAAYHEPLRRWLADPSPAACSAVEWIDPLPEGDGAGGTADARRRLVALAAAAAAGRPDLATREAGAAVIEGEEAARIEETLLQVVPYAGFPRTIAAFAAVRRALPAGPYRRPSATSTRVETKGRQVFRRVYGDTAFRVESGLGELHQELRAWTIRFAYGTVLSRPRLSLLERELLAVGILTALGGLEDPLLGHMRAAVRLGATVEDVRAAVTAVPHALGESNRDAAFGLVGRL